MPGLIAESKPRSVILETPGPLACFGESFASWYFKTPWLDSSCHNYLPLPFSPVCGSSRIKCSLFPSFKPFLNVPILDLPWQCLHFAVGSSGTLFALPEKQKKKAFSSIPSVHNNRQKPAADSGISSNRAGNGRENFWKTQPRTASFPEAVREPFLTGAFLPGSSGVWKAPCAARGSMPPQELG